MELSVFYQVPVSHGATVANRYRETTEQVLHAEALNYRTAWFAEFHFAGTFSSLPSPFLFIASLASITRTIRLGTAAIIPALHHPVRLVEEASMLDVLTGGRLEVALGRGGISAHFDGYGADIRLRGEKFKEALSYFKAAWKTDHKVPALQNNEWLEHVYPAPVQEPYPGMAIVANSYNTAHFAAENGYDCIINSVVNPFTQGFFELASIFGKDLRSENRLSAVIPVLVFEDSIAEQHVIRSFTKYLGLTDHRYFHDLAKDRAIIGSREDCSGQIDNLSKQVKLKELICWFNPGGLIPSGQVMKSMELIQSSLLKKAKK